MKVSFPFFKGPNLSDGSRATWALRSVSAQKHEQVFSAQIRRSVTREQVETAARATGGEIGLFTDDHVISPA